MKHTVVVQLPKTAHIIDDRHFAIEVTTVDTGGVFTDGFAKHVDEQLGDGEADYLADKVSDQILQRSIGKQLRVVDRGNYNIPQKI